MGITFRYRNSKSTLSLIKYHFVFCTRYRRKIFIDKEVKVYFRKSVRKVCNSLDIEIISVKCCEEYVHLHIDAPPNFSPTEIMAKIKSATSKELRREFEHLNHLSSLWTRSYLVSTEAEVSKESIQQYIEQQKTRG